MAKKDPEVIDSPLSRLYTDKGKTVEVCIYTLETTGSKWALEVIDLDGNHTVWDDLFDSDQDAWDEFMREVTAKGINQYIGAPPDTSKLH
ncbi:MAG: hypothetical protein ACO22T_09555 [Burkholderiales bacterium]|jgi:hypothetical protein